MEGVHTVFKRFYYNDCQMQILLNKQMGDKVRQEGKEYTDLVYSIVLNTTKHYLKNPPTTTSELLDKHLVSAKDNGGNYATQRRQIMFLNHTIILPKRSIKKIENGLVILKGDASMKAHYRLGVGINRILYSYHSYIDFYYNVKQHMLGKMKLVDYIVDFAKEIESKLMYFVEFQASTIFLEPYCDFILFFTRNENLLLAQTIAIKDYKINDYIQTSRKQQMKLIEACIEKYDGIKLI